MRTANLVRELLFIRRNACSRVAHHFQHNGHRSKAVYSKTTYHWYRYVKKESNIKKPGSIVSNILCDYGMAVTEQHSYTVQIFIA